MLAPAAKYAIELAIKLSAVRAVCKTLNNGELITIEQAGIGAMITETQGVDGQMIRVTHSDARSLIVWPEDLRLASGDQYEPHHGDEWTITLPKGQVVNGECAPFPPDRHWRWTDRYETARRIHLKIDQ